MSALESLLDRAELCFERGQFKMVASYLDEIDKRSETMENDEQVERYNRLAEQLEQKGYGVDGESNPDSPVAQDPCGKCGGSGKYYYNEGSTGTCFNCQGKGRMSEQDVVRVKNYWAFRRGEIEKRKEATVKSQLAWPF